MNFFWLMNSNSSNLMSYCTLAIEFFWLKNYTSYYYINSFSLLHIFFSLILSVASFFLSSPFLLFFFSLILSIASQKRERERERVGEKKERIRVAGVFLNVREKKKIKKGLGWVEIGWTRVWRRKTRKKKKKKKKWKCVDENELNDKKNNIKNKGS